MRCLVTGGAGFIGSHLVGKALERGYDVTVLDDLSSGRMENLSPWLDRIEFVRGDIRDREAVGRVMADVDVVFHEAAVVSVPVTIKDPVFSAQVNDLGFLHVLMAAKEAGAKRVVFASSAAVYGDTPVMPHVETMTPLPKTPYAAHKLLGEHYAGMFRNLYGLDVICLRYFNVFGPRQDPSSPYSGVISIFMDRLKRNVRPTVFGDGGQSRDFVYVEDVVEANLRAAEAGRLEEYVMNVGVGKSITLNELLAVLSRATGREVDPEYKEARAGDIYESRSNADRIFRQLDFSARVPFEEGIRRTWEWFRNSGA